MQSILEHEMKWIDMKRNGKKLQKSKQKKISGASCNAVWTA